jgi:hypothetical protein
MLLKRLRRALIACREDEAILFMRALMTAVPDTKLTLDGFFKDSDAEYLAYASEILEQLESSTARNLRPFPS